MRNNVTPKTLIFASGTLCLCFLAALFSGCGKSPDELYSEGKSLILYEESFDKGIETLLSLEKKFPEYPQVPEVMLAVAMSYQERGDYDKAVEVYDRLIDNYPDSDNSPKGMFLLGFMYYENIKDNDKATAVFTDFIAKYPDTELSGSAKVLLDNIGLPLEEWSIIKALEETPIDGPVIDNTKTTD